MQVPAVGFIKKFSLVANDTIKNLILNITLFLNEEGWLCEVLDVEAAFLELYLDNKMYTSWSEGMVELGFLTQEEQDSTCIHLRRSMYGNVDAVLTWLREFKK